MKTVLLAGHAPAQNQVWREELAATGQWEVMDPVETFAAARVLLNRQKPDLLISELRLPDGTVIDMLRMLGLGLGYSRTQVLVVGRAESDVLLLDALHEGADNFFDPCDPTAGALTTQVQDTLAGGAHIAPWIARHLLEHFDASRSKVLAGSIDENNPLALTGDERMLLRQLVMGRRLAEVAHFEKAGPRVLSARVRTIYRKMQWDLRAGDLTLQAA